MISIPVGDPKPFLLERAEMRLKFLQSLPALHRQSWLAEAIECAFYRRKGGE
jgi:hypothetical protein